MPSETPLISVGMPSYNKAGYLAEAIDSVLAQTHANLELIISDDRSTDGSAAICEAYARKDSRIRFVSQPENLGMIRNFDFVLEAACGEYFMWFSADDRIDPNWLETCLDACRKGGAIGFGRIANARRDGSVSRRYPLRAIEGPPLVRIIVLYWTMHSECNMLHGVSRASRIRARGGLSSYSFAGQAFDALYVWEAALDGNLRASDGAWLYKRDSPNNRILQSGSAASLLGHALWPAVPLRRVLMLHRTKLPMGYKILLAGMFVPRCVYALVVWYYRGLGVAIERLGFSEAA